MIQTTVQLDTSQITEFAELMPKHIRNAQRSAVRTTTTLIKNETEKRLSAATGIIRQAFKRYRVKSRVALNNDGSEFETGVIWIGYNKIYAAYGNPSVFPLGKLEQSGGGAFAGDYYFQGGFIAKMKSGHLGIFKRTGKERLPIDEQGAELPQTQAIQQELTTLASDEVYKRFVAKLTEYEARLHRA